MRCDPLRDDGRVGEVAVGRCGGRLVPANERRAERTGDEPRAGAAPAEVAVRLVEPAGGRVAVDDLAPGHARAVRPAARTADDDVGVDAHRRERGREERQREPVVAAQRREPVERPAARRRANPGNVSAARRARCGAAAREGPREREHDALGAAALRQVVVDERDHTAKALRISSTGEDKPGPYLPRFCVLRATRVRPTGIDGPASVPGCPTTGFTSCSSITSPGCPVARSRSSGCYRSWPTT